MAALIAAIVFNLAAVVIALGIAALVCWIGFKRARRH
jgi:hypothetical protein